MEQGGHGKGSYWSIAPSLYRKLVDDDTNNELRRRIGWDAAKTRVLSMLMDRAKRGEPGISNQEIRQVTKFSRSHALNLIKELQAVFFKLVDTFLPFTRLVYLPA